MSLARLFVFFFFFNDTATTEIYTLSLHDALPIYPPQLARGRADRAQQREFALALLGRQRERARDDEHHDHRRQDRKSTRLNSSHLVISYAVFCLKKKNTFVDTLAHRRHRL